MKGEGYSGQNVDPTGEVVAPGCQVRRDQVSRTAVSERQVSETGTVSVTGETVEQTEQETSENPLPEQRRSKCKLVLLLNSKQGDRRRHTAVTVTVTATTPTTAAPHCHTQSGTLSLGHIKHRAPSHPRDQEVYRLQTVTSKIRKHVSIRSKFKPFSTLLFLV